MELGAPPEKWEKGYRYLLKYWEANGDCLVPVSFQTEDGYGLWEVG